MAASEFTAVDSLAADSAIVSGRVCVSGALLESDGVWSEPARVASGSPSFLLDRAESVRSMGFECVECSSRDVVADAADGGLDSSADAVRLIGVRIDSAPTVVSSGTVRYVLLAV